MSFFKKNSELIITIHGFGTKTSHEMDPLSNYLRKQGYPVVQFDMYNPTDPQDADWKQWIQKAEEQMRKAVASSRPIVVIGFSMGGVIASYLASIYPVAKLILVAPAFSYMDFSKIEQAGKSLLSSSSSSSGVSLSKAQTQAFMNVVSNYKGSVGHVECPTLILHGTDDEIIPVKSSRKAFEVLPAQKKRLILLEGGRHRMLYDGTLEPVCFALIKDMLKNELF